jgi:hypothetical protein
MFIKSVIAILLMVLSFESYAILDFLAEEGKEATEVMAYTTALTDLITEIDPNSPAAEHSKNLDGRIRELRAEISQLDLISNQTGNLLRGPDLSSKRVVDNINSLTRYLHRLKALLATVGVLGTEGSIAINTAETNRHLSEIQKNQQAQLLMLVDSQVQQTEREVAERKKWSQFLNYEKKVQKGYAFRKH